ncbi:MAG: DUF4157 domain-containing protein [Betaproteobacteria bacterium]|nr:DUF4157 domain-containing protein [Betaproteobacteria bacterium]
MKTHAEAKASQPPSRAHSMPTPNALAHQAQQAQHRDALIGAGVQTRLKIGASNDPLEREADVAAERVTHMPEPSTGQASSEPRSQAPQANLIQTKASTPTVTTQASPQIESSLNSLNSGGAPLDTATRAFFEPRFGQDFSQVRIHTGSNAAQMNESLNAKAFTLGNDIAFAPNQYSANTSTGRNLLGHELAHVVQQRGMNGGVGHGELIQCQEKKENEGDELRNLIIIRAALILGRTGERSGMLPKSRETNYDNRIKVRPVNPRDIGIGDLGKEIYEQLNPKTKKFLDQHYKQGAALQFTKEAKEGSHYLFDSVNNKIAGEKILLDRSIMGNAKEINTALDEIRNLHNTATKFHKKNPIIVSPVYKQAGRWLVVVKESKNAEAVTYYLSSGAGSSRAGEWFRMDGVEIYLDNIFSPGKWKEHWNKNDHVKDPVSHPLHRYGTAQNWRVAKFLERTIGEADLKKAIPLHGPLEVNDMIRRHGGRIHPEVQGWENSWKNTGCPPTVPEKVADKKTSRLSPAVKPPAIPKRQATTIPDATGPVPSKRQSNVPPVPSKFPTTTYRPVIIPQSTIPLSKLKPPPPGRWLRATKWAAEAGAKVAKVATPLAIAPGAIKETERTFSHFRRKQRPMINAIAAAASTAAATVVAGIVDDAIISYEISKTGAPVVTDNFFRQHGSGHAQHATGEALRWLMDQDWKGRDALVIGQMTELFNGVQYQLSLICNHFENANISKEEREKLKILLDNSQKHLSLLFKTFEEGSVSREKLMEALSDYQYQQSQILKFLMELENRHEEVLTLDLSNEVPE